MKSWTSHVARLGSYLTDFLQLRDPPPEKGRPRGTFMKKNFIIIPYLASCDLYCTPRKSAREKSVIPNRLLQSGG